MLLSFETLANSKVHTLYFQNPLEYLKKTD
nr:MAG TPA: hypothetical protein [Bacteriophage sp.]